MNQAMNAKEAKDFLVQQTAEQATLENVPLSDLEKRMMYFVENDPMSCSNPLELNSEFEAQYDAREYEAKIGGLLQRAHKRLKVKVPGKYAIGTTPSEHFAKVIITCLFCCRRSLSLRMGGAVPRTGSSGVAA